MDEVPEYSAIATLCFPSFQSARVRLYTLARKGLIVNQVHRPNFLLWRLSREGFERLRGSLDWDKERVPDFFQGPKVDHYLEANDLYVELAPRIGRVLGPYPAWEWRNEARSFHRYELGGRKLAHQPDAEIIVPGRLVFLERQSKRGKYARNTIREKVASYKTYTERVLRTESHVELLFACDLDREKRVAVEAGEEFRIKVVASSVRGIASHIENLMEHEG